MPTYPRAVPATLAPYVDSVAGFDYVLPCDLVHYGLPSTSLTVVIAFDEPLDCGWLDRGETARRWRLASGLHARPALIRTHGRQHGIQLGLTPLGSRVLLGVPAAELAGDIADHDELPRGIPDALRVRMAGAGWPERFALLEAHLHRAAARQADTLAPSVARRLSPELTEAWRVLRATRGQARVERVARHVGWSRRHLAACFIAEYGLSPKQVARVARFHHARTMVEYGVPLAAAAASCGYVDQSHLNREWLAFAARTPLETLSEFPNVQAEVPAGR